MDLLVYRTSSRTALHLQRAAMVSETRCTAKSAMTVIRLMAMAAPRAANVNVVFPMRTVLALTYQKAVTPPRLGHPPKRPKHKVKWSNYLLVTANTDEMNLLYVKQPSQIIIIRSLWPSLHRILSFSFPTSSYLSVLQLLPTRLPILPQRIPPSRSRRS